MGFHLSSFFHYDNANANNTNQVTQTTQSEGASNYHVAQSLRNFSLGQTISGEVLAVRNGEIDIALDKDTVMTAKLARDMNIAVGQTLTFEVKTVSGSQISLSPLFENMAQNSETILNAMKAAHIPMSNTAASMVSAMMEEGMSIDKESLQSMYKQIVNNPEVSGKTIIEMNRLQIPVTPENITQFENYKNYEHSILNGASEVAGNLTDAFQELIQNGSNAEIQDFFQKVIQIFGNEIVSVQEGAEVNTGNAANVGENTTLAESAMDNTAANSITPEQSTGNENKIKNGMDIASETETANGKKAEEQKSQEQLLKDVILQAGEDIGHAANTTHAPNVLGIIQNQAANLAHLMQQAGMQPELILQLQNGDINAGTLLKELNELLQKTDLKENIALKELLNSQPFLNILKNEVTKQWLIQPEEVAREGKVEELYQRIQQQTAKLAESMSALTKENSPLMKSVTNLSQNVDFMNQLNQTFTYVQLPLKMSNQNAHGDLYVYTNKKNLAKKDGNVSALLHLEMEHLGTMDIYVAMQQNKVSTKFYLEKEEYLDFIEANIHILDERLQKRGYSMTSEMVLKEKETGVIDEMLKQDKSNQLLSKYSFDVRA